MKISEKNIVKRWEMMANKDLGTERNVEASEFAEFFQKVFDGETQISGMKWTLPILRGFAINFNWLNINVVETLDLNYVNIDKEAASELDDYLMMDLNWFDRYQYVSAN